MSTAPPDTTRQTVTVGVDLGGTGTRVVALSHTGVVLRQLSTPTATGVHTATAVAELVQAITGVAAGSTVESVGIGATGPIDHHGVIHNPDTLAAFSGVPLAQLMSERLGIPCAIDNDAATAALGENTYGAGRGSDALLVVTLGTGIGVAMLNRGQLVRAGDGSHPEAGHIEISGPVAPCYCGLQTCWEQLASRTALDRLTSGRSDQLAELSGGRNMTDTTEFHRFGQYVGAGLGTLVTVFKPDRIILGGGAARFLELFRTGMSQRLARVGQYACIPPIRAAELGDIAGAVGAAVLGRRHRPPTAEQRE